jgi:hypothetical protein
VCLTGLLATQGQTPLGLTTQMLLRGVLGTTPGGPNNQAAAHVLNLRQVQVTRRKQPKRSTTNTSANNARKPAGTHTHTQKQTHGNLHTQAG